MLWLKSFHLIFVVTWFAGLFYLPRLFVYHAMNEDVATGETFKVMERRLMMITHIGGALATVFGVAILITAPRLFGYGWLHVKLTLVAALIAYHVWCLKLVRNFARDANERNHRWYRWFNEVPTVILILVVILAVVKPF